jgi:ferritin-like metal-binding protein YciE
MPSRSFDEQLTKYLTDAHSIEEQALVQLRRAPEIAGDPEIAALFSEHLAETETQERLVRERLEAHGGSPSRVKEAVMKAGGLGFVLFAKSQPDTPGKLVTHAYSYEALEQASYELLLRVAERAGDEETAATARRIRDEEREMAGRLQAVFDRAAEASLQSVGRDDLEKQLTKYLADAHALEGQSMQLLERGPKIGGEPELEHLYAHHLEETRHQRALLEARLDALGGSPSRIKDAAMRLGALNWGMFFQAQPDTPGKLAAFAFALEHLEIGGYEQLRYVARKAGDEETVATVDGILAQERAMAGQVAEAFDRAAGASLEAQGVTV